MSELLDLEMPENDAGAATVRDYFQALLKELWEKEDSFSGKRPFGNSGWQYDVYVPMIKAGLVDGTLDEDGYVEDVDTTEADKIILTAISTL